MVTSPLIIKLPSNSHTLEIHIQCSNRFNRPSSNIYSHNTCPTRILLLRNHSMIKINIRSNLLLFNRTNSCPRSPLQLLSQLYNRLNIKPLDKLVETNSHPRTNLCPPFKSLKHVRQNSKVSSLKPRSPNKGQKSLS